MDRFGDLEISEDIGFQEREWTVQRIGWIALLALLLLAALGLFGHGPISWTTAASEDGTVTVSFERFGRRGGTQALVVRADASTATSGRWELQLTGDYLDAVQFPSISPQPDSSDVVPGGVQYTFVQARPEADLEVTFSVTPDSLWGASGDLHLAGRQLSIDQFFFP